MSEQKINNGATLKFLIPASYSSTFRAVPQIPLGHKRVLQYASPLHITWGSDNQNFILQQNSILENPEIGLVEINVEENSLLRVECVKDASFLIYTLQGNHFLYMDGYGPVPLFSLTYTLQPVPEGSHRLLITPGICAFLYIVADELLLQFQKGRATTVLLEKYMASARQIKVLRLPVDAEVSALIQQLMELPADPDPFLLPYIANQLILQIAKQQHDESLSKKPFPANIMVFIAENIQMPVPWLLRQLQEQFSINRRTAKAFLRSINL